MPLLTLEGFSVWRERTQVVHDVSLAVDAGTVLVLEGPNGAGKTTLLEGLAGLHRTAGAILLGSRELPRSDSRGRVLQGISLSPDGRHLFTDMTVRENLLLGAFRHGFAYGQRRTQEMVDAVPWLRNRLGQRAGTLSGGEQQLVAVCRALMSEPTVLLLDAATSGLAPAFRTQVSDLVREFAAGGERAVLLADDDGEFVEGLVSARAVLSGGRVIATVSEGLTPGAGGPAREGAR